MVALMELLLVPALRTLGWSMLAEVVGFLVLRKLGTAPGEALDVVLAIGGMSVLTVLLQYFSKNLSWISALPFSKRQLVRFHYGLTAIMILMIGIGQLLVATGLGLLTFKAEDYKAFKYLFGTFSEHSSLGVLSFSALVFWGLLAHLICASIFITRTRPPSAAQIRRARISFAFIVGSAWLFAQLGVGAVFDELMIVYVLVILALNFTPVETFIKSLALNAPLRRHYRIGAAVLSSAQCLVLLGFAFYGKNSGNATQVNQAVSLLGAFAGRVDDAVLVKALEGIALPRDLQSVAAIYRMQKSQGLTVQNAMREKTSVAQISAVMQAFDPITLNLAELLPLFGKLDALTKDVRRRSPPAPSFALYRMLDAPLNMGQMRVFLELPSPSARLYVLLRARYHRDAEQIELITAHLDKLSPTERPVAALTLAILRGKSITNDPVRALASEFMAEPDCGGLQSQLAGTNGSAATEGMINICLRKQAKGMGAAWMAELDALGWIGWPVSVKVEKLSQRMMSKVKSK